MADIILANSENLPASRNPFEIFRNIEHQKLEQEQGFELYTKTLRKECTNLSSEYWSFNEKEIQKEFNENPNIVKDLEDEFESAKDLKAKTKIINQMRKYKRHLIFKGLGKQEFIDEQTGVLKVADVLYFYDSYSQKTVTMGQARLVGEFHTFIKLVGGDPMSLIGEGFIILYAGREQNKNNAKMSDRFEILKTNN
jgi:hypothetical protein